MCTLCDSARQFSPAEATEWLRSSNYIVESASPRLSPELSYDTWERRAERDPALLLALITGLQNVSNRLASGVVNARSVIDAAGQDPDEDTETDEAAAPSLPAQTDATRLLQAVAAAQTAIGGFRRDRWINHGNLINNLRRLHQVLTDLQGLPAIPDGRRRTLTVRRLSNRLRLFERQGQRIIDSCAIVVSRAQMLQSDDPPEDFDNLDSVRLDMNDSRLVPIIYSGGRARIDGRIDPRFAMQVIGFVRDVRRMGVSRIYSNGFSRPPKSPVDMGHTRGLSWDVTGFDFYGVRLDLWSGRSPDHPFYENHPDLIDPNDTNRRRASGWYVVPGFGGNGEWEVNPIFDWFRQRIRAHFGNFNYIGPGYNRGHDNHFHIQFHAMQGRESRFHRNIQRLGRGQRTQPNDTVFSAPATRSNPHPREN